jgi:hypothetical protein
MPRGPIPAGVRPSLGRGRLTKLLIVLVVLAALLEGADLLVRHVAQDTIAGRAVVATGASSGSASVSGWPLLWDVFGQDSVPGVDLRLRGVPVGKLDLSQLNVDLSNVGVSSGDLITKRALRLTGIGRAQVTAVVTASELSAATGRDVEILPGGQVAVDVSGVFVKASVAIDSGDVLVVDEAGMQILDINLSTDSLVPTCSMTFQLSADQLSATCTVSPVPARVLAALSAQA